MQLTMTVSSKQVLDRLANAGKVIDRACVAFLKKASLISLSHAKQVSPVDKGTLRKSLTGDEPRKNGMDWSVAIGSNVAYAPHQELGTGIYGIKRAPITPKRAKMLRFTTKAGQVVFAKSVRGVPKKEFLKKGVEKVQENPLLAFDEADKIIQESL